MLSIAGSAGVVPVLPNSDNVAKRCQDAHALPPGVAGAARVWPGSVGPLGTIASISTKAVLGDVVTPSESPIRGNASARVRRFMLQSGARELLPGERVSHCLRTPVGGLVSVLYSPKYRAGHLGGLQTCGSVWSCPVCSAKISEKRASDLTQATHMWRERGGLLFLVTLTLKHSASDPLLIPAIPDRVEEIPWLKPKTIKGTGSPASGVLGDLMQASYLFRTGGWWTRFQERYGLGEKNGGGGTVRSLEVTDGSHGWHPHLHVLFFVKSGADRAAFTSDLKARWGEVVEKVGGYASTDWGCDVRSANEEIAAYLAKFGKEQFWTVARELSKSSSKNAYGSGRSMNELLEAFVVHGDHRAGVRWREYAKAFKGRNQHVYSPGLRGRLGLDDDKTDEELAAQAVEDAVVLALMTVVQWRVVLGNDARGELCDVASSGDPALVSSFLSRLGVELGGGVDDS